MKINNQEINIDDLLDQKYMHKEIKKGIFLKEKSERIFIRKGDFYDGGNWTFNCLYFT